LYGRFSAARPGDLLPGGPAPSACPVLLSWRSAGRFAALTPAPASGPSAG